MKKSVDPNKEYIDKLIKPIFNKALKTSKGNKNSKPVKKSSANINFYFSIIDAIRIGIYPSELASKLGITKQRLNPYIKRLKIDGILIKKGQGTWEINEEKYKELLKNKRVKSSSAVANHLLQKTFTPNEVRGHGFQFKLKIPKLKKWEKRREFLKKKKIPYIPIGSNWKGERIIIKGTKIWLTPVSIVVYAPKWKSWFADISRDAKSHAIFDFLQLIKYLENLLKVSFEINKKYKFKVTRQHYGLVKNALAKQYDREGKKLHCYTENGLWMIIDNSYNLHETDTVHPETADDDNIKVQNFFNSLKENPITADQILNTFKEIANIQGRELEKRDYYAENLKSHTNAIIKLGNGIDKLIGIREKPLKKPKKQPKTTKYPHSKRKYGLSKEEEKTIRKISVL